jgi:hypothetical protein
MFDEGMKLVRHLQSLYHHLLDLEPKGSWYQGLNPLAQLQS